MRTRHHPRRALAILSCAALATLAAAPKAATAHTTATWLAPVSGNWTDATKWSTNPDYPNNGTPAGSDYDAVINVLDVAAAYTVSLDASSLPQASLTVNSLSIGYDGATLALNGGTFQCLNGLNVNAGTFSLNGGTLKDTTIGGTGGTFIPYSGTLDDVSVARDTSIGTSVTAVQVIDGLTLDDATFTVPQYTQFEGNQNLDGTGTVLLAGINRTPLMQVTGGNLNVGSGVTISGAGDIECYQGTLTNDGTILADHNMTIDRSTGNLINNGLLEATNGKELLIEGLLDNTKGIIRADGGTVAWGGGSTEAPTLSTAVIGQLEATNGGLIELAGPIDNTGRTLTATSTTGPLQIGGHLTGGTMASQDGSEFFVYGGINMWSDVVLTGALGIRPKDYMSGAQFEPDHMTLDGGIISLYGVAGGYGPNASIWSSGDQTIAGTGQIVFEGNNERNEIRPTSGTLTLAPGIIVRTGQGGGYLSGQGTIINQGTISAQTPGYTIYLSNVINTGEVDATNGSTALFSINNTNHAKVHASDGGIVSYADDWTSDGAISASAGGILNLGGTWSSSGSIDVTDSTLNTAGTWSSTGPFTATNSTVNLGGTFPVPTSFSRDGGTVNIVGMLQNTPNSLVLNATTGSWQLGIGGTISGGTISTADGTALIGNGGTIDSSDILGDVQVPAGETIFLKNAINHGTTAAQGTISITGGSNAGAVSLTGGTLSTTGNWSNSGTITSAAGGGVYLGGNWSNSNSIAVDHATLQTTGTWSNTGSITTTGASITLGGSSTSIGSMSFTDSALDIAGDFTTAQVMSLKLDNTSVSLGGTIDNGGDTLVLSPAFAPVFSGGIISGGILTAAPGFTPMLQSKGGLVLDGVDLQGPLSVQTNATLILANAWTNQSTITMDNATLEFAGHYTTPDLAGIQRAGGTVNVTGTMNNTGNTFTIDNIGTWNLAGTISGGKINCAAGAVLTIAKPTYPNAPATLDATTFSGTLAVPSGTTLNLTNALTLDDAIMEISEGQVNANGTQSVTGIGLIRFDSADSTNSTSANPAWIPGVGYIAPGQNSTLTLGAGITVETGTGSGSLGYQTSGATIINKGLVASNTPGQSIMITGGFTNQGRIEADSGGTITIGLGYSATGAINDGGTIEAGAGSTITSTYPLVLHGGTIGGDGAITVSNNLSVTANTIKNGSDLLDIRGGAGLTIDPAAQLNITGGGLIVRAPAGQLGSWNGSAYTGLTGLVQSGRNGGTWDGPGIMTSAASAHDAHEIGIATAAQALGIGATQTGTWMGQTVGGNDVLLMYTYGGDANLDGQVNIDDYGRIDANVGQSGAVFGWFNGDFNYDGKINIDDYGIIDSSIGQQGAPLGVSSAAVNAGITAVPEPAELFLLPLIGLAATRKRRR